MILSTILSTLLATLPQDADTVEKRLKSLEAGHAAQEKRLEESEKKPEEAALKIKDIEKRMAESQGTLAGVLDRLREIEASRAKLEQALAESQKARQALASLVKELEAARAALEKKLAESEKAGQALASRLQKLEAGSGALEKTLQKPVRDLQSARAALERRADELDRAQGEMKTSLRRLNSERSNLDVRLDQIEEETLELHARVMMAEAANREDYGDNRRLSTELWWVKLQLLLSNYGCSDGNSPEKFYYPFQDHFAYLGVEYEYLGKDDAGTHGLQEREGIRLKQVHPGTPAHEAGLRAGDIILRVNGEPVKPSGLRGRVRHAGRWVDRALIPDYVTAFLPGERARLDVADREAVRKVSVRFGCRVCGEKCPFSSPAEERP